MEVLAQKRLKFLGNLVDHSTVRLGSGAVPRFSRGVEIAVGHFGYHMPPVDPHAPMDSVTQVGSPENRALYSGVLANFTRRSFMIK